MKTVFGIVCIGLFCCSCTREVKNTSLEGWDAFPQVQLQPKMAKIWDGTFPLVSNAGEPICILWYEPVEGLWNQWYPEKVFSDTDKIRQIMDSLSYPETKNSYMFRTDRYLLIIGVNRSLKNYSMTLVPFMFEKDDYVLLPTGRDQNLGRILNLTPAKENFYGSDVIDISQILPRMPRQNGESVDPNKPAMPMKTDF